MAKLSKEADGQYVRKETFWLVTLLALSVGFFGGVMFGVFKTDTVEMPGRPAPAPTAATDPNNTGMIAALEKETRSNPGNLDAWISLGNAYLIRADGFFVLIRIKRKIHRRVSQSSGN